MKLFLTGATGFIGQRLCRRLTSTPHTLCCLAVDQVRTVQQGFRAEGHRAERELGLVYTPIRQAIEEAVTELKK